MPSSGRVRDLFLRLLGVVFTIAFVSLWVQLDVLQATRLLPAGEYLLRSRRDRQRPVRADGLLIASSDTALHVAALAGIVASLALAANVAPRFASSSRGRSICRSSTSDRTSSPFNGTISSWRARSSRSSLVPGGLRPRPRAACARHPAHARWLVFRLNFESGAAKLSPAIPPGAPDRDGLLLRDRALPTWLGWYATRCRSGRIGRRRASRWVELALAPLVSRPRQRAAVVVE